MTQKIVDEIIEHLGLPNLYALSKISGVARSTLYDINNGKSNAGAKLGFRLAVAAVKHLKGSAKKKFLADVEKIFRNTDDCC